MNISTVSVLFVLPSVVSVTVVMCVLLMVRAVDSRPGGLGSNLFSPDAT